MDPHFAPKNVLITGCAGFIGSNVVIHLATKYPSIFFVGLDKLDYCASLKNLIPLWTATNFKFVKGDITSPDLVNFLLQQYSIDAILHFAAQTHVDNSFGNSLNFTHSNVFGTHVLLESAKLFKHQVKRFIHVSTDEVYGESSIQKDSPGFDEKSALNPSNPYAATKAAAELLAKSYSQSFELPIIITRGNNVFGPRQYPEKLIPKFIHLLQQGKACTIHGNGQHRRSFVYVSDVAEAFDLILHKGQLGSIYNIGTQFEISNLDVAKALLKCFGLDNDEARLILFVEDRNWNDVRYHINLDKLNGLGWSPKVNFCEGLKRTSKQFSARISLRFDSSVVR